MIKQIVLDKAPYEKFLLNFSKLVSSCDGRDLILLDCDIFAYISVFSKSNDSLSLVSSTPLESEPLHLNHCDVDDSLIAFRITDTQKHSWFFKATRISDSFSVLKYFSCTYLSLYYNAPKQIDDIKDVYEVSF